MPCALLQHSCLCMKFGQVYPPKTCRSVDESLQLDSYIKHMDDIAIYLAGGLQFTGAARRLAFFAISCHHDREEFCHRSDTGLHILSLIYHHQAKTAPSRRLVSDWLYGMHLILEFAFCAASSHTQIHSRRRCSPQRVEEAGAASAKGRSEGANPRGGHTGCERRATCMIALLTSLAFPLSPIAPSISVHDLTQIAGRWSPTQPGSGSLVSRPFPPLTVRCSGEHLFADTGIDTGILHPTFQADLSG